uniref:Putative phiEco32-like COOH.NH2 ligase-type 2 n=1 Tax=viral metagenome TaxID=1070528 RepID=A0A6M3JC24_9ZZZZ
MKKIKGKKTIDGFVQSENIGVFIPILKAHFSSVYHHDRLLYKREIPYEHSCSAFFACEEPRQPRFRNYEDTRRDSVRNSDVFIDAKLDDPWSYQGLGGAPSSSFPIHAHIIYGDKWKRIALISPGEKLFITTDFPHSPSEASIKVLENMISVLAINNYIKTYSNRDLEAYPPLNHFIPEKITLGADPEFEVYKDGSIVEARVLTPSRDAPVGCDGCGDPLELRPKPSSEPKELVQHIKQLLKESSKIYDSISISGDTFAIGGHIHFGGIKHNEREFMVLLDDFIGAPLLPLSGHARGGYKVLGAVREQPWGFEYRTPPPNWLVTPEIAEIVLKIAKELADYWLSNSDVVYGTDGSDRPTKNDYVTICKLSEEEYQKFNDLCEGQYVPSPEISGAWGIEKPQFIIMFEGEFHAVVKSWLKRILYFLPPKNVKLTLKRLDETPKNVQELGAAIVQFDGEPFTFGVPANIAEGKTDLKSLFIIGTIIRKNISTEIGA